MSTLIAQMAGMTTGDWIQVAVLLVTVGGLVVSPVVGLLWKLNSKLTAVKGEIIVLGVEHKHLSVRVDERMDEFCDRLSRLERGGVRA